MVQTVKFKISNGRTHNRQWACTRCSRRMQVMCKWGAAAVSVLSVWLLSRKQLANHWRYHDVVPALKENLRPPTRGEGVKTGGSERDRLRLHPASGRWPMRGAPCLECVFFTGWLPRSPFCGSSFFFLLSLSFSLSLFLSFSLSFFSSSFSSCPQNKSIQHYLHLIKNQQSHTLLKQKTKINK